MLKEVLIREGLSSREAEVAELVTQGMSNKEVASQLFVTEKTIKFHLTNIYKKMNVKSRAQLIVWCLPNMTFTERTDQQSTMMQGQAQRNRGTVAYEAPKPKPESAPRIPVGHAPINVNASKDEDEEEQNFSFSRITF